MSHLARTLSKHSAPGPLIPGEFLLTRMDFEKIAAMIYADAGIFIQESKATLVYARLAKRLRVLGLKTFGEYCALVASEEGGQERTEMRSALTTNVTNFFREGHHFEHLRTVVLPPLVETASRGGRVRLWSAACSSGQEPYSIAMTILSLFPDAARHDIKILATDIDPNIVAEARQGVYRGAVATNIPVDYKKRFFRQETVGGERCWRASDELRALVAFRELNLVGKWPMKGEFQAIFCRNVVIYFDEPTQQKIWSEFVPRLSAGGWLYIGHSERVSGPASAKFQSAGVSTYCLTNRAPT